MAAGTPMYLPPEAALPFAARQPAQDDIFAIGIIWYQLLTETLERPPYNFADRLRLLDPPTPEYVVRLITRCLADPKERFANACELLPRLLETNWPTWQPPEDCFDVQHLVKEYILSKLPG